MRPLLKSLIVTLSLFALVFIYTGQTLAATTPYLGLADTFNILSSTYTNTVGGTTIAGDQDTLLDLQWFPLSEVQHTLQMQYITRLE